MFRMGHIEASGKGTSASIGGIKVTGEGLWWQAPELETRNLKKNKKFTVAVVFQKKKFTKERKKQTHKAIHKIIKIIF